MTRLRRLLVPVCIIAGLIVAALLIFRAGLDEDAGLNNTQRALAAVKKVQTDGDLVIVAAGDIAASPDTPYLRKGWMDEEMWRGFRRVIALVPSGSTVPEGSEQREFGALTLALWRPAPWHLIAEGLDVLTQSQATVVRGPSRLPCEQAGDGDTPLSCARAGGHKPLRVHGPMTTLSAPGTGYLELQGTHPAGARVLEIAPEAPVTLELVQGFSATGTVTLSKSTQYKVTPGDTFVIRLGPRERLTAQWRWWAPTPFLGTVSGQCTARALRSPESANLHWALLRDANGLSCPLRAKDKPDRKPR